MKRRYAFALAYVAVTLTGGGFVAAKVVASSDTYALHNVLRIAKDDLARGCDAAREHWAAIERTASQRTREAIARKCHFGRSSSELVPRGGSSS